MTTRMEAQWCPCCFHRLDANSQVENMGKVDLLAKAEAKPVPGDYTVCINCAAILSFDAAMKLYEIKSIEDVDVASRGDVLATQAAIRILGPKSETNYWRM
jgi:hypothetical protein